MRNQKIKPGILRKLGICEFWGAVWIWSFLIHAFPDRHDAQLWGSLDL